MDDEHTTPPVKIILNRTLRIPGPEGPHVFDLLLDKLDSIEARLVRVETRLHHLLNAHGISPSGQPLAGRTKAREGRLTNNA